MNDKLSAFPQDEHAMIGTPNSGLTKREYIATACLQGILSDSEYGLSKSDSAKQAIQYTDELLKQLGETK